MRIAVFGAAGRTGRPFIDPALNRGHEVVAFARSPSAIDTWPGGTVVEGDAYTGEGVEEAVDGADAVVSVLGRTREGPEDLLTAAGDHILDAMRVHGVDRYVTLVGTGVRQQGESPSLSDRLIRWFFKHFVGGLLQHAEEHVRRVRASDLEWTVVRAPRLTESEGTGAYRAGDIDLGFTSVPRDDVARLILDCLKDHDHVRALPRVGPA
jgi:putative NADH-flavin reductase